MLNTFLQLLGDERTAFRRYVAMTVAYGVLCGLTVTVLVPVLLRLLSGDSRGALPWLGLLLVGLAASWGLRGRVERAGVRVGVAVLQAGRHRLGDHVATLPVGWFTPQNTARLGHVVSQGLMAVAQLPAHVLTPVIAGIATPIVIVIGLCLLQPALGLIALAALPLLAGVMLLTGRLSRQADEAFQQRFAQASQRAVEFAQAQSVLRAFNGAGTATRLLEDAIERQARTAGQLIRRSAVAAVLNAWAVQALFALLLLAAGWLLFAAPAEPAPAVSVATHAVIAVLVALILASRIIDPLLEIADYAEVLRGARGALEAIRAVFEVAPLPEAARPQPPHDASVELQGVGFRYAPDQPWVLRGVSLRVAPGSMTALIGESGSGKTTLARLVARFFDVSEGRVSVGGVDVRELSGAALAGQISQIFQDSSLFSGSIGDNVRIAKPDAGVDEVMAVVRQAGLGDRVARLPLGLDTPVGEGGARLSGGERQRIAIARALLKDAPILLLDEATAALDPENQAAITEVLLRLRGRRTLIVIAHELSTVALADQIVVLEQGAIVEHGDPATLLARPGHYARLLAQRRMAAGWRIGATDVDSGRPGCP